MQNTNVPLQLYIELATPLSGRNATQYDNLTHEQLGQLAH
jgi:hypothetical protein